MLFAQVTHLKLPRMRGCAHFSFYSVNESHGKNDKKREAASYSPVDFMERI